MGVSSEERYILEESTDTEEEFSLIECLYYFLCCCYIESYF